MPPNAGFAYAKRHKKWVKKRLVCGGGCSPPAGGEGTGRLGVAIGPVAGKEKVTCIFIVLV